MKKREFIKSALAAAGTGIAASTSAADTRLFGTPGSVIPIAQVKADKMRLSFARMDIPPATWDNMLNYFSAVESVASSKDQRSAFLKDPNTFLARRGLAGDVVKMDSIDVGLLRIASDPVAQESAAEGNYQLFLERLKDLNVTSNYGQSDLSARISKILLEDVEAYTAVSAAMANTVTFDDNEPAFVTRQRLAAQGSMMESDDADGDGLESQAYLSTSISVYTNVMAITNVAAVTQAGAVVAAYLIVAVAVAAVVVVLTSGTEASGLGRLARLDPRLLEEASKATAAARVLGNKGFELSVISDLLRQEVTAIYDAAEAVGIIKLKPRYKEMAITAALEQAHKGLGLNSDAFADYKSRIGPKSNLAH